MDMTGLLGQSGVDPKAAKRFSEDCYLGLPRIPADKKRPAWDYDFACILACDATEHGTLLSAWDGIHDKVREALWEGTNTFVMILRAQGLKPAEM
jgi:hypothetical protein